MRCPYVITSTIMADEGAWVHGQTRRWGVAPQGARPALLPGRVLLEGARPALLKGRVPLEGARPALLKGRLL